MGQRKLTNYEQQLVYKAWNAIGRLNSQLIPEIYSRLSGMRVHGTTDGKPYVEPQPEIPEGYRSAVEGDESRQDAKLWVAGDWGDRPASSASRSQPFDTGVLYIVPVDRIPTDDDAKQRPTVMVRDVVGGPFFKATLLAVVEHKFPFVVALPSGAVDSHRFCRFPYPGE